MNKPLTVSKKYQPNGYRAKPKESTVKLIKAFTDLAIDSSVAYAHHYPNDFDAAIDSLFYRAKWASRAGIHYWYCNLQNMKLAYNLGYLDLIAWGSADWLNDCCDYFRDDVNVAAWFRKEATPYIESSSVKLPKMGEIWGNDAKKIMVSNLQANRENPKFYYKEMLVIYDSQATRLINFLKTYKFLSVV